MGIEQGRVDERPNNPRHAGLDPVLRDEDPGDHIRRQAEVHDAPGVVLDIGRDPDGEPPPEPGDGVVRLVRLHGPVSRGVVGVGRGLDRGLWEGEVVAKLAVLERLDSPVGPHGLGEGPLRAEPLEDDLLRCVGGGHVVLKGVELDPDPVHKGVVGEDGDELTVLRHPVHRVA